MKYPLFSQFVKEKRKALGLTQQKLADKAVVHVTYITHIERGDKKPKAPVASRLCAALNLGSDDRLSFFALWAAKEQKNDV